MHIVLYYKLKDVVTILNINSDFIGRFCDADISALLNQARNALSALNNGECKGNDFIGWCEYKNGFNTDEVNRIKTAAEKIKSNSDILIVVGIGGSYLGAKCAVDFLKGSFYNAEEKNTPSIYFAGNTLSPDYLSSLLALCKDKDVSLNVVSKSGTTTEPAVAFRVLKDMMYSKYGDKAAERIYVTTDANRGALKSMAVENGYEQFVIPDDVGGRFSVLSAVGLLPIAVCGADIDMLLSSAQESIAHYLEDTSADNAALEYAVYRHLLYNNGKATEILVNYEPSLCSLGGWWQQLFGESHGKDGKGILPITLSYSTDLHSMGQYVQQGVKNLFETVIWVENNNSGLAVPDSKNDSDGLNYLAGKDIAFVNEKAYKGTLLAHVEDDVPNIIITIDKRNEAALGDLFAFFFVSCAIGGGMLDVNTFNQPGVEAYKKNMFALLGKKGYESLAAELNKKL